MINGRYEELKIRIRRRIYYIDFMRVIEVSLHIPRIIQYEMYASS